ASFGDIARGASGAGTPAIRYKLDTSVSCGSDIVLDVAISSTQKSFVSSCVAAVPAACSACVTGPLLQVTGCSILDTCTTGGAGDNNGRADPGEDVGMTVT